MAKRAGDVTGDDVVHYEPPRKSRGPSKAKMQAPLMPMIDVTFQLLLFFILLCEFRLREGQIPGTLPDTGEGPRIPQPMDLKELTIALRPTSYHPDTGMPIVAYFVGRDGVGIRDPAKLYNRLRAHQSSLGGSKEIPIMIEPRDDVPWQYVIEAYNQAFRAEFENIGFAVLQ